MEKAFAAAEPVARRIAASEGLIAAESARPVGPLPKTGAPAQAAQRPPAPAPTAAAAAAAKAPAATLVAAKRPAAAAPAGEAPLKRTRRHPAQQRWRTDLEDDPHYGLRYWSYFLNEWVYIDDYDGEYIWAYDDRRQRGQRHYISTVDGNTGDRWWSQGHYDPRLFR